MLVNIEKNIILERYYYSGRLKSSANPTSPSRYAILLPEYDKLEINITRTASSLPDCQIKHIIKGHPDFFWKSHEKKEAHHHDEPPYQPIHPSGLFPNDKGFIFNTAIGDDPQQVSAGFQVSDIKGVVAFGFW